MDHFFQGEPELKTPFKPGEPTIVEKISPYVCEFIGTFVLVISFGCSHLVGGSVADAYGFALMVLIYSVGSISGGNFNPAVSLMLGFLGKLTWPVAWLYILIQFLAGISAGLTMSGLYGLSLSVQPSMAYGLVPAAFGEVFYTTMLCFVVANCEYCYRNNPKSEPNQFYAIAIGFVVIAGGYATGPITGGLFNPALAIGFGLFDGILYLFLHVLGAALGSMLFRAVRPEDASIDGSLVAEAVEPSLEARVLAEFLGTLALGITFGLNLITQSTSTGYSVGCILVAMAYSLADVSGAHFNPAVSLAVWLCGRIKCRVQDLGIYMLIQLLAGIIAGVLMAFFNPDSPTNSHIGGISPKTGHSWGQVFFVEMTFTFLLAWVVLAVATTSLNYPGTSGPPKRNFYFALAIGMSLTVGIYAMESISRGCLNPAIAVGMTIEMASLPDSNETEVVAVFNTTYGEFPITQEVFIPDASNFLRYWWYDICGAVVAALIFHVTHAHEFYAKNA